MGHGTVSILGCGWLGSALGKVLAEKGFSVKGSVTSPEKFTTLFSAGISPFRLLLSPEELVIEEPDFFETDILIISVPPRRITGIEEVYPDQIRQIIPYIVMFGIEKVIFISSTSVYPENNQHATESDQFSPDKESGIALLLAENLLTSQTDFRTTVLRFGGLIGADRNPAKFLLKSTRTIANAPVNLIHRDDCIGIITAIIEQNLWGETLNACSPEHPLKKEFYGKAAQISGLPEPQVGEKVETFKTIDSRKLMQLLNYKFIYSSPMEYLDSLE
ncbi:MAG: NAD-dependent epimerase/dehydratase family protein [Prolixibacteraceae bacterium]|jgi:nucleoside-diphosphate-sugar epimerase